MEVILTLEGKGLYRRMSTASSRLESNFSDREESKTHMFVIVSTYRAKVGEEDAIIALHEDWQRKQGLDVKVYLSWELLRNIEAPQEFIVITHFESEELARAMADDLNKDAWYTRLVSLLEERPTNTTCVIEWRAP
jgi:heme-degrading monooxygenase HmoA